MNETLPPIRYSWILADPDELVSLPAWLYRDEEFFAHEAERVFRPSWQIVCHINDIPKPGDYHTFEFLGESDPRRCAATTARSALSTTSAGTAPRACSTGRRAIAIFGSPARITRGATT